VLGDHRPLSSGIAERPEDPSGFPSARVRRVIVAKDVAEFGQHAEDQAAMGRSGLDDRERGLELAHGVVPISPYAPQHDEVPKQAEPQGDDPCLLDEPQRSEAVLVLGSMTVQILGEPHARAVIRQRRELQVVRRVLHRHGRGLPRLREPPSCVLRDGRQHAIAAAPRRSVPNDERVLDEAPQRASRGRATHPQRPDLFRRLQRPAAREDRHAPEQRLFRRVQQIMAPVERRIHRSVPIGPMAIGPGPAARVRQPLIDLTDGQD
jgi:hypothetical protein